MRKSVRWSGLFIAAQLIAVAVVLSLVLTACGGDSSSSSTDADGDGTATDTAGLVQEANENLEGYYAGEFTEPPTTGPEPEPGKRIWIVPCSVQAPGCTAVSDGAEEAAEELGWDYRTVDGKLSPAVYNQVIRQATAAGIDGLALIGVNCSDAPSAIKAAIDAGIKVAAEAGDDCPGGGFSTYPVFFNGKTNKEIIEVQDAEARVDWLIANLDGKAKTLLVTLADNDIAKGYAEGLEKALAKCPECEVIKAPITTADFLEGKIQGKIETLLVQNPQANSVLVDSDPEWTGGVAAAVKASGRDLLAVGAEGLEQTISEIRSGEVDASGVLFLGWSGWSLVDALNRAFAGETGPVESGNGYALVDSEHGLPPEGRSISEEGPLDYDWQEAYRQLWGVDAG